MDVSTKLLEAVDRSFTSGFRWYVEQQQADGSFTGVLPSDSAAFYNVLYLFHLGGAWRQAESYARWARKSIIEPDHTSVIDPGSLYANKGVYFKGWNIYGAHACGCFDLSLGAIDNVLAYQDQSTGGLYCSVKRAHTEAGLIDFNATSLVGLAAMVTGRTAQAESAADCVVRMLDLQPDLPHRIYSYLDPTEKQLLIELPGELGSLAGMDDIYHESKSALDTDIDPYTFCLDNDVKGQVGAYAILSMAFVFLCTMFLATGKDRYRGAAWELFEFMDYARDRCWIEGQTTKVLWGLAQLHAITGEKKVLRAIEALAGHLCAVQVNGKGWVSPIIGGDFDRQPAWISLALTGDVLLGLGALLRYS